MPPINVLIKPVSSSCNLKCKYCFYYDVAENRDKKNYGKMSIETLELLVERVFDYGKDFVGFAFQGGEPTLAGLDFYKRLIEVQVKYNTKKLRITNSIQTNGISIDEEWCEFLADNNFLVGISLDGPKDIHDINRLDENGVGSFKRIDKTISMFNNYGVQYNVLAVVTRNVVRHVDKVYNYYSKKGFNYIQFIPCLDELKSSPGRSSYSLSPKDYESFLKRLFDLWYKDFIKGKKISIRMFDNIIMMLMGYAPESCDMAGRCSANPVVEADGSVYPCDFYVLNEWKLGDIYNSSMGEMLEGSAARSFIDVSVNMCEECNMCEFRSICRGGCRRHYEPIRENEVKRNYFCSAYKGFYSYTINRFYETARRLRNS